MKRILTIGKSVLVMLTVMTSTLTYAIDLELNTSAVKQMTINQETDGSYSITSTGRDPNVDSVAIDATYDASQFVVIEFEYKSTTGLDDLQIFFRNANQGASGARRALLGPVSSAADWTTFNAYLDINSAAWTQAYEIFRFDFGRIANRSIQVRNFKLRELTEQEIADRAPKETVNIELNLARTSGGLTATVLPDGSYQLDTSGGDPWIASQTLTDVYDPEVSYIISFEYRAEKRYNSFEIFYGPVSGTRRLELPELPASAEWRSYAVNTEIESETFRDDTYFDFRFDFGKQEFDDKTIFVRNIQIRKPTPEELEAERTSDKVLSRVLNAKLLAHLDSVFDNQITSVIVKPNTILISGNTSATELFLADIAVEQDYFDAPEFTAVTSLSNDDGTFTIELDRFVPLEDRMLDRLYSRWVIVQQTGEQDYAVVSDPHWADDVAEIATNNQVEQKATSIKGLDGLTRRTVTNASDLEDLGVKSMKLNLILSSVLKLDGEGIAHEFNGKTYQMATATVLAFDELVKTASDLDLAVGVVLLIPTGITDPTRRELFVHPDADRGIYSMANVATTAGVEHYAATIDFLAERYSDPDGDLGRIAYWIIHNEVDAHQTWTYAGKKPEALYGELYQKSMRIVYYTARKYDPTAKVYASYTHHWNARPGGNAQNFKPKDMLARLEQYSDRQGDFEWGIGYHSYPLSLFNPKTWNDAAAQTPHNLNANFITPRNLEMIDVYARQVSSLYNDKKVRTVILSENGMSSNVNRNPNATLENQAAGVAFFWKKASQGLASIENIQYHRWVDNPNEAGLEFGLWTNGGENPDDFGEKKPSWYVWQAADTPDEDNVFAEYLAPIGISDWSEIITNVPTETTPYRVDMSIQNCAADTDKIFVSFNGERKRPQVDGSVSFFNVASNVDQPYVITKGDVLLAQDNIEVDEDTALSFDYGVIENFRVRILRNNLTLLGWGGDRNKADAYNLYVKNDSDEYTLIQRRRAGSRSALVRGLQPSTSYQYRLVPELNGEELCASEISFTTLESGFQRFP